MNQPHSFSTAFAPTANKPKPPLIRCHLKCPERGWNQKWWDYHFQQPFQPRCHVEAGTLNSAFSEIYIKYTPQDSNL